MIKIKTTFVLMKKGRNIFLNLLVFLIVFFCTTIYIHTFLDSQQSYVELSSNTNNIECSLTLHLDSSDEDQMNKSHMNAFAEQPEWQQSESGTSPLLKILFVSVWQPPKIF
jgi:hypothetical protein